MEIQTLSLTSEQKEVKSMRDAVEHFLVDGNSLKSGINAVHNLTAALWVKASEGGFIQQKKIENDNYSKLGNCGVDKIADHTADLGNGRKLEAKGLEYYSGSTLGGVNGTITITNLRGNKIEIRLQDEVVMRAEIDGKLAITDDGKLETMAFSEVIGKITRQYLALETDAICAGPRALMVRALEDF